ncbi:MAG: hypothetical protein U5Q03_10940 [Bacteroidota bacterium]|nr:hypothetical protein [Bacteroidota bacterium]
MDENMHFRIGSNTKTVTIIVWFNCNLDEDGVHADRIFNRFDEIVFKSVRLIF